MSKKKPPPIDNFKHCFLETSTGFKLAGFSINQGLDGEVSLVIEEHFYPGDDDGLPPESLVELKEWLQDDLQMLLSVMKDYPRHKIIPADPDEYLFLVPAGEECGDEKENDPTEREVV